MKKLLIFALAMSSYAASASVLLWLVDSSAASSAGIDSWDKVMVSYSSVNDHATATDYLSIGGQSVNSSNWDTYLTATQVGNITSVDGYALADLSFLGSDKTSQFYFVELYSGSSLVGYSEGLGSTALNDYIKEWSDLSNMTQSMQGWSAGGFTAVPEPTSGMLMLFGMALLGLRRKKAV